MRHVQEGAKSNTCSHMRILTGLEVRTAAARQVEWSCMGEIPLDVGIMFGPHLVDRAHLHGAQEKQSWLVVVLKGTCESAGLLPQWNSCCNG